MNAERLTEGARRVVEADKARREEECRRALGELLQRHGCTLEAMPERVAGLWTFRIIVKAE